MKGGLALGWGLAAKGWPGGGGGGAAGTPQELLWGEQLRLHSLQGM